MTGFVRRTKYPGLGLSLEIVTPEGEFAGFAFSLPILDVWYGRWVIDDVNLMEQKKLTAPGP